jgi:hypothetical protein
MPPLALDISDRYCELAERPCASNNLDGSVKLSMSSYPHVRTLKKVSYRRNIYIKQIITQRILTGTSI